MQVFTFFTSHSSCLITGSVHVTKTNNTKGTTRNNMATTAQIIAPPYLVNKTSPLCEQTLFILHIPIKSKHQIHNQNKHSSLHTISSLLFLVTSTTITMNSLELAYQLTRMSIDYSSSVPTPPEMLSDASMSYSSAGEFELDCYQFDSMTPASSFNSMEQESSRNGWGSNGLSRSRCAHNLSTLGSSSSADSLSLRQIPSHESRPNGGWGYYVDTPSR